jgi:hypothetical protein
MQDDEEKQNRNGAAQQSPDAVPRSPTSSPSISSSITSSLLSSTTSVVSSSCRQPETSVSYAAVDSSSITQQGREETVEQESGKKVEAVPKDADETTAHTTILSTPLLTPLCNTNNNPLPPFCMSVLTAEHESKSPPQFNPGSIESCRRGAAGTKRKSKQGGGGKRKHSKMMP